MFTGIIEAMGEIRSLEAKGGDLRIAVHSTGLDFTDVALGDSIATDGVCLTVTSLEPQLFWADVSNETIRHSSLNRKAVGAKVNLEKAMLATSRFGGHIVTGHVDGLATVQKIHNDGRSLHLELAVPEALRRYIAAKGSVCIDGVSLTVNALSTEGFALNIVPHTVAQTCITQYRVGSEVNVEVDIIARYLEQLGKPASKPSAIDREFLQANGFYK
jgi:riboflavin synthase